MLFWYNLLLLFHYKTIPDQFSHPPILLFPAFSYFNHLFVLTVGDASDTRASDIVYDDDAVEKLLDRTVKDGECGIREAIFHMYIISVPCVCVSSNLLLISPRGKSLISPHFFIYLYFFRCGAQGEHPQRVPQLIQGGHLQRCAVCRDTARRARFGK